MVIFSMIIFAVFSIFNAISSDLKRAAFCSWISHLGFASAVFYMGSDLLALCLFIFSIMLFSFQIVFLSSHGTSKDGEFSKQSVFSFLLMGSIFALVLYFMRDLEATFLIKSEFIDYSKVSGLLFENNYLSIYLLLLLAVVVILVLGFLLRESRSYD